MSGMRQQRQHRFPAPLNPPVDISQERLRYTWHTHRRRKRWLLLIATLVIFGAGTGVLVVLLAEWLIR
jgi:hypothetical protein